MFVKSEAEIDFSDIAYVKVNVIALQKIYIPFLEKMIDLNLCSWPLCTTRVFSSYRKILICLLLTYVIFLR